MAKPRQDIVPIEQVPMFYRIAYAAFLRVERLVKDRARHERAFKKRLERLDEDRTRYDRDRFEQLREELVSDHINFRSWNNLTASDEERLAVVAVTFSAFALEALINDYLISNVSKTYLKNYLDMLTPVSKWLTFPQLVAGKRMSTDGQTFQGLKDLFRLRNELAHFKSGGSPGAKHVVTREEAQRAIEAVRLATAQLKKLDPRVSSFWRSRTETDAKRELSA